MSKEELKEVFRENIMPLIEDKEVQSDEEIIDFYLDVLCIIAEDYKKGLNE